MRKKEALDRWLSRGRQRRAVLRCIQKPMMQSQIVKCTQKKESAATSRDVTRILHQLLERGVVYPLDPDIRQGRLYWFTDYGMKHAMSLLKQSLEKPSGNINWGLYSYVVSSSTRPIVLAFMNRLSEAEPASVIRSLLRKEYPLSFTQVHRALGELRGNGLVRYAGYTKTSKLRTYSITIQGRLTVEELLRLTPADSLKQ